MSTLQIILGLIGYAALVAAAILVVSMNGRDDK